MKFTYARPESIGISSKHILCFLAEMEEKHIPMHSFLLFAKNQLVAEGYYAPYKKETLHRMFSISKSVTALAIGLLEAEGRLSLSDSIITYFPEKLPKQVHPWIAQMTIRDMLMMRTCHASTTYKGASKDWVGTFFNTTPTHKSGTIFHYDTSSAHVLCALVEKLVGMPLWDYIKSRIPELNFSSDSYIISDPDGVSMGGSGLVATPTDMLKLGYLLLHKGNVSGRQVISEEFIVAATSCLTETIVTGPIPSESCGYGYMIWVNEKGGYVCYGMGGQFIMVFPEKEMIFVTTADTQGIGGGNQFLYDSFYRNIYNNYNPSASSPILDSSLYTELQEKIKGLSIPLLFPYVAGKKWDIPIDFLAVIDKKNYQVHTWNPATNQTIPACVSGFTQFSFKFSHNGIQTLYFTLNQTEYQLSFGIDCMATGIFPIYNLSYAANGAWIDNRTLYIRFHIIDEYLGSVHMQFYFGENDLTIFMKKVEESCFLEFNGHFYAIAEQYYTSSKRRNLL